ncbi:hypothetical protein G5B26_25540 [Enterocloster clostridioformis]|uniref:DUF3847 domain-containing protein n=1 Tax=Enterocloster clostridioformis TaxID=1531 RepID=A0ABD6LQ57_9FIRM|nr:hypothetical protein [Enterocloster clostridioformis]NSJ46835.1 hypothetical protein [Enterocloster clostridioformis]
MEQKTITPKEQRAIDKVKRANAELAKIRRDQKKQLRREQNNHKYMMGGCVAKYFPDGLSAFDFDEKEMNRIIACAFSLKDVKNMITTVLKERPEPTVSDDEEEDENDDFVTDETEENDPEESGDDEGGEA